RGRRPEAGAELRPPDAKPGEEAHEEGEGDPPRAVVRQEHETEVPAPEEGRRDVVRLPGRAVLVLEEPLDDEGQPEGEEEPIEGVEPAEAAEQDPLEAEAEDADGHGGEAERPPRRET